MSHPVVAQLQAVLSPEHIATDPAATEHYRSGWRSGQGKALAVVFPQTLVALWRVLEVCVNNNCIIIMQAAKTGLTEGSTPSGDDYDREMVVINTLAMDDLIMLEDGKQVISFPGATLHKLEDQLKPFSRSPHSVIGSSCLGASIVGGVANNSGGALIKRGPAYTQYALYAQVNEHGELHLVNHLGIELGSEPEEILTNLENGTFDKNSTDNSKFASAQDYADIIRDVDASTPARYNADPGKLFEASGCAGKLAVFAVRLDTFAKPEREQTFYIGVNDPALLAKLRRHMLAEFTHLPEVAEYMHRDIFDVAKDYGKDTFLAVKHLGTGRLPKMFAAKGRIDALLNKQSWLPSFLSDRIMQSAARLFPNHLPDSLMQYRNQYEHHLILKMSDEGIEEADAFLKSFFAAEHGGNFMVCSPDEASAAFLHRFAAAGAALRYQLLHEKEVGDILALDIALRRNDMDWVETLPPELDAKIEKKLYYGHFFCHVFHQDYILKKGTEAKQVKAEMLALLDNRGAKYPAEHNVGHLYDAEDTLKAFYRSLDPTNTFNPGIGHMEKTKRNCACC